MTKDLAHCIVEIFSTNDMQLQFTARWETYASFCRGPPGKNCCKALKSTLQCNCHKLMPELEHNGCRVDAHIRRSQVGSKHIHHHPLRISLTGGRPCLQECSPGHGDHSGPRFISNLELPSCFALEICPFTIHTQDASMSSFFIGALDVFLQRFKPFVLG